MTAPLSTNNTRLRTYIYYRYSQMKSRFIALCLISLFSFPLLAAAIDIDAYANLQYIIGARPNETRADLEARIATYNGISIVLMIAGMVLLAVLFLQGLFTAKENFRHLWNKKYTDMDMSLPISANTRFAGSVITGFGIYFIPQIIAVLLSLLLLIPADGFIEQYRQLSAFDGNSADIGTLTGLFRSTIGYIITANVMQYFFSLMIVSFCGRKLTANIVPFIFVLGVPFTTFFLSIITGVNCYGVNTGELLYGPLWDATPIGMILSADMLYPSQYGGLFSGLWWLRGLIYSAIYGTAAYFLIKYRREERAGSAFVYKLGRYATEFLIMLATASAVYLSLFTESQTDGSVYGIAELLFRLLNIPDGILLTVWIVANLLVFIVIELVSREKLRKPKNLALAAGRFVLSAGLSFLVCFGFMKSDGFGAADYVPDVSEVGSMYVSCYTGGAYSFDHNAEITGGDAMRMMTDFHRRIISERPDMTYVYRTEHYAGEEYEDHVIFRISYGLRSGGTVSRTYYLPVSYAKDAMMLWFESGAFASDYEKLPDTVKDGSVSVSVYDTAIKNNKLVDTGIPYEKFVAALKRDAAKATYEDLFISEGVDYINTMVMIGDNSYRMKVWSSFDETLSLMREYNCETFENVFSGVVKYYIFKATSTGQYTGELKKTYMNEHGVIIPYQQPKEYRELTEEQAKALLTHSSQQTVYENSRDIYIILPISEHRSEYDGSIIYLLGAGTAVQYYVTEPNCETAAEVYANAPAVSAEDITKYLGEYYY